MSTKNFLLPICLVAVAMSFSCKSKTTGTAVTEKEQVETSLTTYTKGKYALKSGIVEYKTQMMGMEAKQTLTFDDYGKLEIQEVEMEMMGTKIHSATLTKDGFIYQMDLVQKTGTKSYATAANNPNIDFENISEQMAKDMNLTRLGKEEFLGKTCEKMSIDYAKMQLKGTYLVYKGVALYIDTNLGTMQMKLVAEKLIENPQIPASRFEVPSDIVITN